MPNSDAEAEQLKRFFGVPPKKIRVVYNAVDPVYAEAKPDLFLQKYGLRDFILCVGRIEPRKNQLGMIRVLSNVNVPFVLIGDPVKTYPDYYQACRKEAGTNVHFLGGMPHDSELLRSAYAACNTFLLASWLETPGLAALEAALAGARIVITQEGATREYFQGLAAYVNPADPSDICLKTLAAHKQPRDMQLKKFICESFLWKKTAQKVINVYKELL